MLKPQAGHRIEPELLSGFDATMAGDDGPGLVDQDRIVETEGRDAGSDLSDLVRAVNARVAAVRPQIGNGNMLDGKLGRHGSGSEKQSSTLQLDAVSASCFPAIVVWHSGKIGWTRH